MAFITLALLGLLTASYVPSDTMAGQSLNLQYQDSIGSALLDDGTELALLQIDSRARVASSRGVQPQFAETDSTDQSELNARAIQMMESMDVWVNSGFWAQRHFPVNGCGTSTFHELGMSIKLWQQQHPGVDGFCHFQNYAFWFQGAGAVTDYKQYGISSAAAARLSTMLCEYLGDSAGPSWNISFKKEVLGFAHLDACADAVDDPYCYSLGWLKGQHLDGTNMSDIEAWKAKGKAECQRIQDTYNFIDEEVTVGRHIASTPVYLHKSLAAALGAGPPVSRRMYNEHVYTKCLLGDALGEMAYCYYKGCVLPDGRISHGSECGYD